MTPNQDQTRDRDFDNEVEEAKRRDADDDITEEFCWMCGCYNEIGSVCPPCGVKVVTEYGNLRVQDVLRYMAVNMPERTKELNRRAGVTAEEEEIMFSKAAKEDAGFKASGKLHYHEYEKTLEGA